VQTPLNVWCEGCHEIKLKYAVPKYPKEKKSVVVKQVEAAVHLK